MKKIVFVISFVLLGLNNKAFCSDSFYSLKGGISAFTSKLADESNTGYNIELGNDYLFSKYYEWNLAFGYEHYSLKANDDYTGALIGISFKSGFKYYFNRKKYEFSPYIGFSMGVLAFMDVRDYNNNSQNYEEENNLLFLIELKPNIGISYPISRYFVVFSELGYSPNIEFAGYDRSKHFFSDVSTVKLNFGISVTKD